MNKYQQQGIRNLLLRLDGLLHIPDIRFRGEFLNALLRVIDYPRSHVMDFSAGLHPYDAGERTIGLASERLRTTVQQASDTPHSQDGASTLLSAWDTARILAEINGELEMQLREVASCRGPKMPPCLHLVGS